MGYIVDWRCGLVEIGDGCVVGWGWVGWAELW